MKRIRIAIFAIIFFTAVQALAQQGQVVKTDGTKIPFRHLVGIMHKDTAYSEDMERKNFFTVDYNGKTYELLFEKLKSIAFFKQDTTFMYRLETKTGLSKDIPLNFVGIEYITDDPFTSDMMRVCLPVITNSAGTRILNIKEIDFIY
jgi:hypothetical protein